MRVAFALLALALTACSSDPAPAPGDVPATDVVDVVDVVDAADAADAPDATEDRPAPVDVPAVDVVDVPALEIPDASEDVGAVDAGLDVPAADAPADVADVPVAVDAGADAGADVPRDGGAVDAGPAVYDLEAGRAALEAHFAGRRTLPPPTSTTRVCPDDPSAVSCSVAGGVLNFSLGACYGTSLTGRVVLGDAGASTLSIFGGGGGSFARVLRVAAGPRGGGRRNFHVQFSAPPFQGEVGFDGIPGRTVDPALADLWLLGCPSD